jgi:DnaK suppressor protein
MSRDDCDFGEMLLHMKKKLIAEVVGKPASEAVMVTPEIGDEADQAGEDHIREISLLLTGRNKEKLVAIEAGLEKIRGGNYGTCEECGEKIALGRLKVMPLAKYCVNCQSGVEKELRFEKQTEEELRYQQMASEMEQGENN